jgi:hypothetical protein
MSNSFCWTQKFAGRPAFVAEIARPSASHRAQLTFRASPTSQGSLERVMPFAAAASRLPATGVPPIFPENAALALGSSCVPETAAQTRMVSVVKNSA